MKKKSTTVRLSLVCFIYLFTLLFVFLFQLDDAQAEYNVEQLYQNNRIDFQIDAQYSKSTANFNSSGSKKDLVKNNYFQTTDVHGQLRWGLLESLGIRLGAQMSLVESSNNIITDVSTRNNSGLESVEIGFDYLMYDAKKMQIITDIQYDHALATFSNSTDDALLGQGSSEFKANLILRKLWGNSFFTYIAGGVNYRFDGLSTLAMYDLGMSYDISSWGIGVDIKGYSSVLDDSNTNTAYIRDNVTIRVDGGSFKYYSVNPNLTQLELFTKFVMFDQMKMRILAGYDIAGSNISQSYYVGGSLIYSFDGFETKKMFSNSIKRKKKKEQEFKEETKDGVDQDYFQPITPNDEQDKVEPIKKDSSEEVEEELYQDSTSNGDNANDEHQSTVASHKNKSRMKKVNAEDENPDYQIQLKKVNKK